MKPDDVLDHYGSVDKAAEELGVSIGAIYQWRTAGTIPPLRQSDIEVRSGYLLLSDYTKQRRRCRVQDQEVE